MTKLTLTKEEMIENLYLVAEEITLQCMILNRRKLVQAFINIHPHVDSMVVKVMPANTIHRKGIERPEPLGQLDIELKFRGWQYLKECHETYSNQMEESEIFIRYLDHLIAMNKRIEVDIREDAAWARAAY